MKHRCGICHILGHNRRTCLSKNIQPLVKKQLPSVGRKCTENGKLYEEKIRKVFEKYGFITKPCAGCSHDNDIQCLYRLPGYSEYVPLSIEVKNGPTPDWGQCTLTLSDGRLYPLITSNTYISRLFRKYIHGMIFNGKIPPFILNPITFKQWNNIKDDFRDEYYNIDNKITISNYYRSKNCAYIQIRNVGLYHTGSDVLKLGVPLFKCNTRIRIRCKRHGKRCPETGKHVPSSVTMSLVANLKDIERSRVSLDDISTLCLFKRRKSLTFNTKKSFQRRKSSP